jgi:hypothetical protein
MTRLGCRRRGSVVARVPRVALVADNLVDGGGGAGTAKPDVELMQVRAGQDPLANVRMRRSR